MKSILATGLFVALQLGGAIADASNGKPITVPVPKCVENPCAPGCPGSSTAQLPLEHVMCCNGRSIHTYAERCNLKEKQVKCTFGPCVTSSMLGEGPKGKPTRTAKPPAVKPPTTAAPGTESERPKTPKRSRKSTQKSTRKHRGHKRYTETSRRRRATTTTSTKRPRLVTKKAQRASNLLAI